MHTHIIDHYNPSVRIIDLVSHNTYVVCVNFIYKWWDIQFKFDSERQIFCETFHGSFTLLSEFLPEIFREFGVTTINLRRAIEMMNIFYVCSATKKFSKPLF